MTFVNANGACGTTVNPGANGPFLQKKIGRWTNLNVFPGDEALRFDFGWLRRNPWLLATSVLEAGLAFAAMFAVLLQSLPLVVVPLWNGSGEPLGSVGVSRDITERIRSEERLHETIEEPEHQVAG